MVNQKLKNYIDKIGQTVVIEELDNLTIHYTPLSYGEAMKIQALSKDGQGNLDEKKAQINVVIQKCKDKEGNKIFSLDDIEYLEKLPVSIFNKIALSVTGDIVAHDVKKN